MLLVCWSKFEIHQTVTVCTYGTRVHIDNPRQQFVLERIDQSERAEYLTTELIIFLPRITVSTYFYFLFTPQHKPHQPFKYCTSVVPSTEATLDRHVHCRQRESRLLDSPEKESAASYWTPSCSFDTLSDFRRRELESRDSSSIRPSRIQAHARAFARKGIRLADGSGVGHGSGNQRQWHLYATISVPIRQELRESHLVR